MTTLVTVKFFRGNYGYCVKSCNQSFPASVNGSFASTKTRLVTTLKRRMNSFYPARNFIFNFSEAK